MSNFDIAVGFSTNTFNMCCRALFEEPATQKQIFEGRLSADCNGQVSLAYNVLECPRFDLNTPSKPAWESAIKAKGVKKMPEGIVQVRLAGLKITANRGGYTENVSPKGVVVLYTKLTCPDSMLKIQCVGIAYEESLFMRYNMCTKHKLLVPLLAGFAVQMLDAMGIPTLPRYEGIYLDTPSVLVEKNMLLVASKLATDLSPLDLGKYKWPAKDFFALHSPRLMAKVITLGHAPFNLGIGSISQQSRYAASYKVFHHSAKLGLNIQGKGERGTGGSKLTS